MVNRSDGRRHLDVDSGKVTAQMSIASLLDTS
jgi:hypothetical protein